MEFLLLTSPNNTYSTVTAMNKLGGYIHLMRPLNCAMMGFAVLVGAVLAFPYFTSLNWLNVLYGFLTGFTFCAAAMVINDYYDRKIDAINEPQRPIPSGAVKPKEALAFMTVLIVVGSIFSLLVYPYGLLCFLVALASLCNNCNIPHRGQTQWITWQLLGKHLRSHSLHLRQRNHHRHHRHQRTIVCFYGFLVQYRQRSHQRNSRRER